MIVYKIINKINGKIYIGQTVSALNVRWSQHVHNALKNKGNSVLYLAIKKYGVNNFECNTITRCNSIEEMNHREKYYINLFKSLAPVGYNLDSGGKNKRMHQDTKDKLSKAKMGKKLGPHSESHRKNLSIAQKGRKYPNRVESQETKQKRSLSVSGSNNPNFGKKWTEEKKKKASESKKGTAAGIKNPFYGKKHSDETKTKLSECKSLSKIKIVCLETSQIFESINHAARVMNIDRSLISNVIKGKYKKTKGLTFRRL